jgi:hypothetical protein
LLKCVFVSWVDLLLCADVVSQLSGRIARWATNSGNQEVHTESEDISSRGVYFFLPTEIEKGSWVELALVSATRNNLSRACVRARYWHFTIVLRVRVELLVTIAGPPLIICHAGELTLAVKAVTLPALASMARSAEFRQRLITQSKRPAARDSTSGITSCRLCRLETRLSGRKSCKD